ncbi:hypothetical protein FHT86_001732 [Rhizobium sp. BK313]|uniref:hypothetical protein n=1 Tax=Rhizobium sp. BK313 TaxID=2587081 RepID=UPI001060C51A|nr:hypothetical protein [Rhizobium sp. BK313]MBB3453476.1 hypothetical protein [Rhizobium sp. BK313]
MSYPFEWYVEDRLAGRNPKSRWIDEFPLYVVARLCETIGATEMIGKDFLSEALTEPDWAEAAQIGFEVMSEGNAAFEDHLRSWHESFWTTKHHVGGRSLYGRLYDRLAHEIVDPDYDPIRKIMYDVTLDSLPMGPGDFLFGPIEERRLHSVRSAAIEYGILPKTMRKLVQSAGIVLPGSALPGSILSYERQLVRSDAVSRLMKKVGTALDWEEAKARLGVTRTMWDTLADGYVRLLPELRRNVKMHALYGTEEIDAFIETAFSKATLSSEAAEDLLPIEKIVRKTNCKFKEVLDLLLDGRLARAAVGLRGVGLGRLRFDLEEIAELIRLPDHGGLSLREVSKRLTTNERVVRRLADYGYLETETAINPVKRCNQQIVLEDVLDRFMAEFVALYVFARERRWNIGVTKRKLAYMGIEPAFPSEEIGATFYRRRDLPPE